MQSGPTTNYTIGIIHIAPGLLRGITGGRKTQLLFIFHALFPLTNVPIFRKLVKSMHAMVKKTTDNVTTPIEPTPTADILLSVALVFFLVDADSF